MKSTLMKHQAEGLERAYRRKAFGYFCEQGTGKTVMALAEAERYFEEGALNGLLVVAPSGVHTNWTRREIPAHLSCPHRCVTYLSGRTSTTKAYKDLSKARGLHILAINVEALATKNGGAMVQDFLRTHKTMMVIDESSRIKNPAAQRTKAALKYGALAVCRRIMSGTPLTAAPPDLYAQFEFLGEGLLGTTSYRAFVAEYSVLIPAARARAMTGVRRGSPQIVVRDAAGRPQWRNLDKLRALIEPLTYRVLKNDCLDLPPKVYSNVYFQLTPAQQRVYDQLAYEHTVELEGSLHAFETLPVIVKLQQVTSGFVMAEGETWQLPSGDNPRMDAFLDLLPDIHGQFIVWARFREELAAIAAALAERGVSAVEYHGGVSRNAREEAVDAFQAGTARAFVGQPDSGGIGLTLTAADTAVYYSNSFNMEARVQSEDRCHRRGTTRSVRYIDLVAMDTIDERITASLQAKQATAAAVLGDDRR